MTGLPKWLGAVLLGAVLPGAGLVSGCADTGDLPTVRAERGPFAQRVTAEGILRAKTTTKVSVPPEVQTSVRLAWLAADGSSVEAGDPVARFDAVQMHQKLADGRSDLRKANRSADKSRLESEIEVARLNKDLEVADLELTHAQSFRKVDDEVFSRRERVEDAIDERLARERKEHAHDSIDTQKSLAKTDLELLAIDQRRANIEIEQAESGLAALEVTAPHAGILTLVKDWKGESPQVGNELWRGAAIAELPDISTMEAEVFVLEADAGGLAEELRAEVVIEAHPDARHAATVRRVDAVAKPRFRGSPVQYFGAILDFETTDPAVMKPGQRVLATLYLKELPEALTIPRQAVFQEGGESHVYVRRRGAFEKRTVELGPMSMALAVIESGLEEGEEVALVRPRNHSSGQQSSQQSARTAAEESPATAEEGTP